MAEPSKKTRVRVSSPAGNYYGYVVGGDTDPVSGYVEVYVAHEDTGKISKEPDEYVKRAPLPASSKKRRRPPTANERVRDAQISHSVFLRRYSTGTTKEMLALLDAVDRDLVRLLKRRGVDATWTRERLEKMLTGIRALIKSGHREMNSALRKEMRELVAYESGFQARLITGAVQFDLGIVTPATGTVYAAATAQPFQGRYLSGWLSSLSSAKARVVEDAIRIGFVEGESNAAIVRRVRGTRAAKYRDGALATSRRHAEAVVRTAVNHYASTARSQVYKANAELIPRYQYVATLDGRTTDICASLDGKTYLFKDGIEQGPTPPQHINCRSTTTPVLVSWKELGIPLAELPPGTRASMNGQVAQDTTYTSWLRGQPKAMQNEVLGSTKGALFRKGKLHMDRFVDPTGRSYTIAELRVREPAAFKAAGIDL